MMGDHLCIFAKNDAGVFMYLPPLGALIKEETIDQCFDYMKEVNGENGVTRIENVSHQQLKHFSTEKYAFYKKGYEYIYYKDDICELKVNRYKSKRSSYNQFKRLYTYEYAHYAPQMLEECMGLYRNWAEQRKRVIHDDIYHQMIDENGRVHGLVLKHFDQLGLVGRVVLVDGKNKGYTFGFSINQNLFCVLFEITDLSMKGLSVFIFREFCHDPAWADFKFVNVMDDFEMNNVRQTKMSFHPAIMMPLYTVTKRKS